MRGNATHTLNDSSEASDLEYINCTSSDISNLSCDNDDNVFKEELAKWVTSNGVSNRANNVLLKYYETVILTFPKIVEHLNTHTLLLKKMKNVKGSICTWVFNNYIHYQYRWYSSFQTYQTGHVTNSMYIWELESFYCCNILWKGKILIMWMNIYLFFLDEYKTLKKDGIMHNGKMFTVTNWCFLCDFFVMHQLGHLLNVYNPTQDIMQVKGVKE